MPTLDELPFLTLDQLPFEPENKSFSNLQQEQDKQAKDKLLGALKNLATPQGLGSFLIKGPMLTSLDLANKAINTLPIFTATRALRQKTEQIPEYLASKGYEKSAVPLGVAARIATELLPTGSPTELGFQLLGGQAAKAGEKAVSKLGPYTKTELPGVVNKIARTITNFTGANENMVKTALTNVVNPVQKALTDPHILDDLFFQMTEGIKQAYDTLGETVGKAAKRIQFKAEGGPIIDIQLLRNKAIKKFTDSSGKSDYVLPAILDALTPEKTSIQRVYNNLSNESKGFLTQPFNRLSNKRQDILLNELSQYGINSQNAVSRFLKEFKNADFLSVLEAKRKLYRMVAFGIRNSTGIEAPIPETFISSKIKDFADEINNLTRKIGESTLGTKEFSAANEQFSNFAKASGEYASIFGRKGKFFSDKFLKIIKRGGLAEKQVTKVLTDLEKYGNIGPLSPIMKQAAISQEINQPIRFLPATGFGYGTLFGGAGAGAKIAGLPGAIAGYAIGQAATSPKVLTTLGREAIQQESLQRLLQLLQNPMARTGTIGLVNEANYQANK